MDSSKNISAIAAFSRELREAREFRRITLEEVSRLTCVTLQYLKALEDGDWEQVPVAYRRGYLALFAVAAGMNREKVLKNYDTLIAGQEHSRSAILDDSPSVLAKPQHKELTRAKIRTGWYTRLTRHPFAFGSATLILILLGLVFLYLARYGGVSQTSPTSFTDTAVENDKYILGASAIFPLTSDTDERTGQTVWIDWIGRQPGSLILGRNGYTPFKVCFRPYDTIKTQFAEKLTAMIYPSGSAELQPLDGLISVTRVLRGDTLQLVAVRNAGGDQGRALDTTMTHIPVD